MNSTSFSFSRPFWAGLLLSALLLTACPVSGQESDTIPHPLSLSGYGLYDFHYATGSIGGAALMLDWQVGPTYALGVGVEYAGHNRISANVVGMARLAGTPQGKRLCLENRYLWRHFPALGKQEFTGALLLGGYLGHARLHLGLCNRYMAELVQRSNGGMGTVFEPMNVMFAAEAWLHNPDCVGPQTRQWNVGVCWSNYNDFVIERVANWFFSLKGLYRIDSDWGIIAEVGIHPVGSLNLTASYDGWFCHIGAKYRL